MADSIATYDQAIWRLVQMQNRSGAEDKLAFAVELVADVFWYNEAKVWHDMERNVRSLQRPAAKPRRGAVYA